MKSSKTRTASLQLSRFALEHSVSAKNDKLLFKPTRARSGLKTLTFSKLEPIKSTTICLYQEKEEVKTSRQSEIESEDCLSGIESLSVYSAQDRKLNDSITRETDVSSSKSHRKPIIRSNWMNSLYGSA